MNAGPTKVSLTAPNPICVSTSASDVLLNADPVSDYTPTMTGPPKKSGKRLTTWR